MKAILAKIKARREEQVAYRILDLWAEARPRGSGRTRWTRSGLIRSCCHQPCATSPMRDSTGPGPVRRAAVKWRLQGVIYNYVRLKDGGVRPLNPAVRAVFERVRDQT